MSIQSVARLIARYERKVMAGLSIQHHADCHVHDARICTCGLLHDLTERGEDMTGMYAAYYDEKARQDLVIEAIRDSEPPMKMVLPAGSKIRIADLPRHYFCLATIKSPITGLRHRPKDVCFAEWMDAVQALSFPENMVFDTIDYWDGAAWQESVRTNPRKPAR